MAATPHPVEVRVEQLLGCEVVDENGKRVGHIEEIIAEGDGDELVVKEFHVGRAALAERLSFGLFGSHKPHRIKWSDLDLSDPKHPRLTK